MTFEEVIEKVHALIVADKALDRCETRVDYENIGYVYYRPTRFCDEPRDHELKWMGDMCLEAVHIFLRLQKHFERWKLGEVDHPIDPSIPTQGDALKTWLAKQEVR